MKHDIFEFSATEMTWYDRAWRIILLVFVIGVLLMDLLIWRPA